ncbi:MAG: type II secretion system protein GspL, partial [Betaproteobacteria bacterium]
MPSARPSASSASVAAIAAVKDVEWRFVYSRDGLGIDREGMAAPAQLPRADRTVLVLQDEDVSWLQALLPKSAAKRLQPALVGALEDQLLEDAAVTHLAMS